MFSFRSPAHIGFRLPLRTPFSPSSPPSPPRNPLYHCLLSAPLFAKMLTTVAHHHYHRRSVSPPPRLYIQNPNPNRRIPHLESTTSTSREASLLLLSLSLEYNDYLYLLWYQLFLQFVLRFLIWDLCFRFLGFKSSKYPKF